MEKEMIGWLDLGTGVEGVGREVRSSKDFRLKTLIMMQRKTEYTE